MDLDGWETFEQTGKINDYLAYKSFGNNAEIEVGKQAEAYINADKNYGNSPQTTQYR